MSEQIKQPATTTDDAAPITTEPATPTALKQTHAKQEKEGPDEPKPEPIEADEFGLPPRPPRRRNYTLESLDSPERAKGETVDSFEVDSVLPAEDNTNAGKNAPAVPVGVEDGEDPEPEYKDAQSSFEAPSTEDASKEEDKSPAATVTTSETRMAAQEVGSNNGEEQREPSTPRKESEPESLRRVTSPESTTTPKSPMSPGSPSAKHFKQGSIASVSEWSHQRTVSKEVTAPKEQEQSIDEGEWQEMPAFATHTVYDDWGKVLAKEYHQMDDQTLSYSSLGGAGKGYTRVQMDEDAQSATSMDDNTAYLFKDQPTNTLYEDEGEAKDLLSQMQTTKELLTDNQKVAYVGLVRLSLASMEKDMNKLDRTKNTRKSIDLAIEAFKMWAQRIMLRIYTHMEIDAREQIMVEQLTEHGVLAGDLTPTLMANARVKNPKAVSQSISQTSSARPSMASPRPSSTAEKRLSSVGPSLSRSGTPNPVSRYNTPPPDPGTPVDEQPPPAYEQNNAEDLTIQDVEELEDAKNLDIDIRWTALCDLFLLLLADSTYDARSRTLLERVAEAVAVSWQDICRFEKRVTDSLEIQEEADKENWNEDGHMESRAKAARNRRLMVMGLCTVGGGLVIGLSAGLLAPVIGAGLAAGFTAVGVSGTGTFLGGAGAAALIGTGGTLLGGRMGLRSSNRRTGAVKTFEYKPLFNNKRVNLIVTVAGWMTGKVDDVRLPFSTVNPVMGDIYSVNWEPEMLQSTGQTIQILGTEALTQTIQQILGATALSALMAGLATPIVLMKISYLIDNPWTTALARGDAAGLILADSILGRSLGARPITLVGFSLGSRVIFSCLKELARRGAIGLVQNVYLFGSPVVVNKEEYTRIRSIVSGRFVNGYATSDWILGYLFRATSGGIMRVAGLASVNVEGIENIDVTTDVPGHMAYRGMMPTLLDKVGWEMESLEYTEIEDPDPDNHEKRQRELLNEIEEARKQLDKEPQKKGFKAFFSRKKTSKRQAWETYDERSQRVLEGDDNESALHAEENANVMFDVDAIQREALALALQSPDDIEKIKQHLRVKEIESTLPTLKVSMAKQPTINGASPDGRPFARQTQSHEATRSASMPVSINGASSSTSNLPNGSRVHTKAVVDEGDVSMTFEEDTTAKRAAPEPETWPDEPRSASNTTRNASVERPALRSFGSTPTPSSGRVSPAPPPIKIPDRNANLDHNPWSADADDADFGREREMTMSFD